MLNEARGNIVPLQSAKFTVVIGPAALYRCLYGGNHGLGVIFHASGLLCGAGFEKEASRLLTDISREKPNLVIFSGDFAAHGQKHEFVRAKDFLDSIAVPILAVPGSADYPRYDMVARVHDPLRLYRNYIAPLQDTVHEDTDSFVVGINTARAFVPHWNRGHGMVSQEQIAYVHRHFRHADDEKIRILVCAHPPVETRNAAAIIWGSTDLMAALEDQQVDLILTGQAQQVCMLDGGGAQGPLMLGAPPIHGGYNIVRLYPDRIEAELIQRNGDSDVILEHIMRPRIIHTKDSDPEMEEIQ